MSTQTQISTPVQGVADVAAGDAAKARGMAQAEAATAPSWAAACDAAIAVMAARGVEFQAADLIAEELVDEPDDHHKWGPRFRYMAGRGVIEEVAADRSKRATSHRSRLCTWRGTGTA